METIYEKKGPRGVVYECVDGLAVRSVSVTCKAVVVDGTDVRLFYTNDMLPLREPSLFMLEGMLGDSENTRLQAVSALRSLYCFSQIIGIPPESFDMAHARAFVMFLRGTLGTGLSLTFHLATARSESTISSYLKTVRRLMRYLDANDSAFLDGRSVRRPDAEARPVAPYLVTAKVLEPKLAPMSVTIPEYRRLLGAIPRDPGSPALPMVRLMFEHGLRIGEVLGLTLEDVKDVRAHDGTMVYSVILRNRHSDGRDQHAKGALSASRARPSGPGHAGAGAAQEVFVSEGMFACLAEYIEATRGGNAGGSRRADSAAPGRGQNEYVFLNTRGSRLTSNLWNKRLRKYFADAGIPVDRQARKTNLNHRLRHGYAMVLTHELKLDSFAVMTLMRHRSIHSTEVYTKPTAEQVREMQEAVVWRLEEAVFGRAGR